MSFRPSLQAEENLHLTPPILEDRHQYRACHIYLPGEVVRTAAILVADRYYSLVKVVKDRSYALEICQRLSLKGRESLITCIAKGEAIWVWEPEAVLRSFNQVEGQPAPSASNTPTCKILDAHNRYEYYQIDVPDLDKRLTAILVDGDYYGLFKVVETRQQAMELAVKLKQRGDATVISKIEQGEAIWVLEPDAHPV